MKKSLWAVLPMLLIAGCVQFSYQGETRPATEEVAVFEKSAGIPHAWTVLGNAEASGSYQDFTREDLLKKMCAEAEDHGADAILVLGVRVKPIGTRVSTSSQVTTRETTSPDAANSWNEMARDFSGGYGEIGSKSPGVTAAYKRVMRAQFLIYRRGEDGQFLPPPAPPVQSSAEKTPAR